MNSERQPYLKRTFGSRVSFHKTERKLYGHDIAAIPSLIKLFAGNTAPDALVQPETEGEVVELVRWASEHNIPLTPRGKGSSGYGGIIPMKGGIVVDFYHM
ncbi:FAD-binding oxidoreductase [Chloroflexota bacterium]